MRHRHTEDRVVLRLTGEEAENGLPLANFAVFLEAFRGALRDFDRQRQGERTRRGGHPTTREDLVTAFRLVSFKPGSAILELEPIAPEVTDDGQERIEDAELLPVETLRAFMDSIEREDPIDPAIPDALARATRTLGEHGRIAISVGRGRAGRKVVIDNRRVEALERRARRYTPNLMRVRGRLHMIDLEPDRVGIRATDGIEWSCQYPPNLEAAVKALVGENVWATGYGQQKSANTGSLRIDEFGAAGGFEQTELFTFDRVPLEDLLAEQSTARRGLISILPADVTDEEAEDYLSALLDN